MPQYGSGSYWDERYSADEHATFEWYQGFPDLQPYLMPYLSDHPDFEVLIPGCGNSRFSSDLHDAGCCNVSSIDLSSVVIQQMADRYRDKEEMEFTVMDATNLDFFPNECFDLVIDKGLTDAVLCGDKSFERVSSMISEMHRVLKRGGTYIVCSYGVPASRVTYLKKDAEWLDVEIKQIGKPPVENFKELGASPYHFLYICTKKDS